MTLSVIICTRNRGDLIQATLRSILGGTRRPEELLVVDQSDGDDTRQAVEAVAATAAEVRYLKTDTRGLSVARNVGIEHSWGEVIAFTDDDVLVCPDWLEQVALEFERFPRLGLLFGTVLPPDSYDWTKEFVPYCEVETRRPVRWYQKEALSGMGANMTLRRSTAERVGGFDPTFGPGNERTGDDYEYALRCLCHPSPVEMHLLDAARVVHHAGARSGPEYHRFVHQMNGTGMGLFWAHLAFGGGSPRYRCIAALELLRPLGRFVREMAGIRKPAGVRTYAYSLKGLMRGSLHAFGRKPR